MITLYYCTFNTEMGWVGVLGSDRGLLRATLPQSSAETARKQLGEEVKQAVCSSTHFADLTGRLEAYFGGQQVEFTDRLDLSEASEFQRQVWNTTRLIPYGETRSYTWLAGQIHKPKAQRVVGQALGRNPLPIIVPCHRVLAADGTLGGFSGGIEMKKRLLHLESSLKKPYL